ncbi:MAG TPA: hypothetical protein VGJ08_10755 [Rhizomicrobium sp.]|jgi:hypothetical protein
MSQPDPGPKQRPGVAGTVALLLIGLLFLVPSGLCTAILGGGALFDAFVHPENSGDSVSMIVMVALVGGPFVAIGGVLVWLSITRMRRR